MENGGQFLSLEFWLGLVSRHSGLLLLFSLAVLVLAVLLLPLMIARIPADYFSHPQRRGREGQARHPVPQLLLIACKNLLGALLVLLGLVMLLTPGQGVLTLLAGLMLMNYPGKYAFERWLVQRPGVLPGLNWLREQSGHPPLQAPGPGESWKQ